MCAQCGNHDDHCGDSEDQNNVCNSQGKSDQGCCACQHHTNDGGCGTWETCAERLQKEDWTDRQGDSCEDYMSNPDKCDEADSFERTYKGHDAKECCPVKTGRSCGLTPCPAGEWADNDVCTKCMEGKYNPDSSRGSGRGEGEEVCLDCLPGWISDAGASTCTECPAGKYQTGPDTCTECIAGTYSGAGMYMRLYVNVYTKICLPAYTPSVLHSPAPRSHPPPPQA